MAGSVSRYHIAALCDADSAGLNRLTTRSLPAGRSGHLCRSGQSRARIAGSKSCRLNIGSACCARASFDMKGAPPPAYHTPREACLPLPGIRNIESSTNSLVKVFRQALNEGVTREGWIAFEGPLLLEEALNACAEGSDAGRCRIQTVLASRTAAEKFSRLIERLPKEAELAQVPDRLFGRLAQTESPQGIAALVE